MDVEALRRTAARLRGDVEGKRDVAQHSDLQQAYAGLLGTIDAIDERLRRLHRIERAGRVDFGARLSPLNSTLRQARLELAETIRPTRTTADTHQRWQYHLEAHSQRLRDIVWSMDAILSTSRHTDQQLATTAVIEHQAGRAGRSEPREYASHSEKASSTEQPRPTIIPRRPVARAATAPSEFTPPSSPISPTATPTRDLYRSLTMTTLPSFRRGRRTGTRELFSRASESLNTLTGPSDGAGHADVREQPPPYAEVALDNRTQHTTRNDHNNASLTNAESASTPTTSQYDLQSRLDELAERGIEVNGAGPLGTQTALMEAAQSERERDVMTLLMAGHRAHYKDVDGNSALHFAALSGNATICKALLDVGASVEDYNKNGETPIALAARGGHTTAVEYLLDSWTVQRGTAAALTKAYLESLKSGNIATVSAFIERNVKPKKIKETVTCAAEGGSVPTLDFVLSLKASLKGRGADGWSGLHFAAYHGHVAMVERLLALGLSWKAQTKRIEETALAIAIRNRQVATAIALILHKKAQVNRNDKDKVSPLHHAVRAGDLTLMTALLNAGAKLDAQSKYGWTVMHTAAAYGHNHLVAELITRGVSVEEKLADVELDPAEKTNEGARRGYWTEIRWPHTAARPLHLALEFSHDELANLLIAAGAKVEAADGKGWRPLHYAAFSARPVIVELLLGKGASPHATTDDNNTPLSLGFREYGLSATEEDKIRVWELLQGAMNATKKSKRKQLADYMSGSSSSRHVEKRNRVWHTAELAASLHLEADHVVDEPADTDSDGTASTAEHDDRDTHGVNRQRSYPQDVKVPVV